MKRFPAPGDIRDAIPSRQEYAGPPQLTYPPVSQEERDQALRETRDVARRLSLIFHEAGKKLKLPYHTPAQARTIEQQKQILREMGFLK